MLKNDKLINKIFTIAWAVALLLGLIIAAWQGTNTLLPDVTTDSDTALKCGISALLAINLLLLLQSAIIVFRNRRLQKPRGYQAAGLALFALSATVECFLSSAFFVNSPIAVGIAAEILCLEFIPFIVFMADCTQLPTPPTIITCGLALLSFLVQNILAIAGIYPLGTLLWVSHGVSAICLLVSVYAIMRQRSQSPNHSNLLAAGAMIFAACYLLEIIANNHHNIIMMIGIALFLAMIYLMVLQSTKDTVAKAAEEQKVFNQALMDYQTGFGSRLAFNEFYYKLSSNHRGVVNIGVMVIDLNNLKDTNDRYGHTAGDELILGATECIKATFSSAAHFFRTGGDEFAIITIGNSKEMETALSRLDSAVIQYNTRNVRQLSLARGICIDEAAVDDMQKLHIIYKAADDRMYSDKIEKHEQMKVQMIQETYLKKQMMQEQMIREKQFQEQMQRVAEAKQAEDMKKQKAKQAAATPTQTPKPKREDTIPPRTPTHIFPPQTADYFWEYDKKQVEAQESAAQEPEFKEPKIKEPANNQFAEHEPAKAEHAEVDISSMLKSSAKQESDNNSSAAIEE